MVDNNTAENKKITVKGIAEGLVLIIFEGDWKEIEADLRSEIAERSSFFQGSDVYVDASKRPLHVIEITSLQDILNESNITLKGIISGNSQTIANAKNLGLVTSLPVRKVKPEKKLQPLRTKPLDEDAFLIRKNVRSGVSIEKEENIVIVGDVNPGAEVYCGGSVFVWGKIRGKVHAGKNGDEKAQITAFSVEDGQLGIAGENLFVPKEKHPAKGSVITYQLKNNEIVSEKKSI